MLPCRGGPRACARCYSCCPSGHGGGRAVPPALWALRYLGLNRSRSGHVRLRGFRAHAMSLPFMMLSLCAFRGVTRLTLHRGSCWHTEVYFSIRDVLEICQR